ncbi:hypothetical protein LTR47_011288 [Exophiala xenobiotica]|nr:hypothetical protein LTR41_011530 [Exophiala xenobiotica]KAK5220262.1 hypothetical protein LTR47_011288 [Exophiala xenobiotica]KAK5332408.1 hypothetical protein LTR98_011461 [Exophiala xenobiotica]KAK5344943.1 hypothetical protein LTR61_011281 [Exophiala xenobiotica]
MVTVKKLKVYTSSPEVAWQWLQWLYEREVGVNVGVYTLQRIFFTNSLMTVLSAIEAAPNVRDELLTSLLSHIGTTKKADGLESVLLTLLHSANVCGNTKLAEAGTKVWLDFATKPTVSGTGPLLFYNVVSKQLYFFAARRAFDFLAESNIQDLERAIPDLERQALDALINPFNTPYSRMQWLSITNPSSVAHVEAWTSHARDIAQDIAAFCGAAGGAIVFSATAPVTIPSMIAAALIGTGVGILGGILINDIRNPPPPQQPKPTSEVDAPEDAPETAADVNPATNDEGDLGTTEDAGEEVGDSGEGGGGCFVAATPVWMADGTFKPIEDITAADLVMTQSDGDTVLGRVLRKHCQAVAETLLLSLDEGDMLITTPKQRFAVTGGSTDFSSGTSGGVDTAFVEAQRLKQREPSELLA